MSRPSKRLLERQAVFERRRDEARELGLWTDPKTSAEAERRRAELQGLGFEDYASERWEQLVASLRAANSDRRGPEPLESDPAPE